MQIAASKRGGWACHAGRRGLLYWCVAVHTRTTTKSESEKTQKKVDLSAISTGKASA